MLSRRALLRYAAASAVGSPLLVAACGIGSGPAAASPTAASRSALRSEPEFLESQCADLTPFLAGDAIKEYPNLANLPAYAWPTMVFNGKIFAVPRVKGGLAGPNGTSMYVSGKVFDQVGYGNLSFK